MLIRPDVEQAFERAVREAKERHHDEVTAMHLLHALLLQPDLAGMLRKAGGDVSSLREATARRLERLEAFELGVGDEPSLGFDFQRAVAEATTLSALADAALALGAEMAAEATGAGAVAGATEARSVGAGRAGMPASGVTRVATTRPPTRMIAANTPTCGASPMTTASSSTSSLAPRSARTLPISARISAFRCRSRRST